MINLEYALPGRVAAVLTAMLLCAACGPTATEPAAQTVAEGTGNWPTAFGFGRTASEAEIATWDIDVRPDGRGLPAGSGSVADGERIYAAKCAFCHGATGTEGPNDRLVARAEEPFPAGESVDSWTSRTIGNYWPYATTLYDYIGRSMPQNMPGSLDAGEVYALTAYLLHLNNIVAADAVLDADTLAAVQMPARDRFVPDDRLDYAEVR
jgi:hypothetical protein